ncbi:N-acetylmuramoyl-L-alanine amidase [Brevibacterium daeguense]|uniref:N-acetylmuramoyl-L-alanine amidase n=2 Tax=Brevibacterium daeguense TaxID=909936 RepID=A0ABP8EEY8_9MICO
MSPTSNFPLLSLGDTSPVLLATKGQLARIGLNVGDTESPVFDQAFDYAVRAFQQERGIICDGALGPETFAQIELARFRLGDRVLRYDPVRPLRGDDVAELQSILSALGMYTRPIDYVFAQVTDAAVREAQSGIGLRADGIAGPVTLEGLRAVHRGTNDGNVFALQERARVNASGPSLVGRIFVIEAATAQSDFATTLYPEDLAELANQHSSDIGRRLEGRLAALGAATVLVTAQQKSDDLADELGASAVITINLDASSSPTANGAATYYFGREDERSVVSPVGRALAELVQKEICARTDLLDGRVHARTWESLRRLRTPKVHVLPGYITNCADRAALAESAIRDRIAEAIAASLQRLYLREDSDPPTGTLDLSAFQARR